MEPMEIDERNNNSGGCLDMVVEDETEPIEDNPASLISTSDIIFSKYFCIFCGDTFPAIGEAYEHYKLHMNSAHFCRVCDRKMTNPDNTGGSDESSSVSGECTTDHSGEDVMTTYASEITFIEQWIDRFLTYQEELMEKPNLSIINGTKFFLGCPVCDNLIKICNVVVPQEAIQLAAQREDEQAASGASNHLNSSNTNDSCSSTGKEAKDSIRCHTVRHACAHLRYYPFECYACENIGKYQKKPDLSEMMRHIKDNHVDKDTYDKASQEAMIKKVRITKLERFLDYYLRSRAVVRFEPVIDFKHGPVAKPVLLDNSKSKKVIKNANTRSRLSSNGCLDAIKTPLTNVTRPDGSNPLVKSLADIANFNSTLDSDYTAIKSRFRGSSMLLPSALNTANTGNVNNGRSGTYDAQAEANRSSFQRHFTNILDDDEMIKLSQTQEENLNVEYFCIFCEDALKDKEQAKRHYQIHVDYYPMICSLCGEGATDMKEFLKHHTDAHPDAEKGRYKRREQPLIEKWINAFLYAQATIIRAFPPREQCPVCEKVFPKDLIKSTRPKRCTVNRKIDHVHRHLCYLPYECVKCKHEGKEFAVAYFESKAHSHIKLKHPEIDDTESRWFIFQKTISIPKLDDFIASYLTRYGISMDYERRPVKKNSKEALSSSEFLSAYQGDSLLHAANSFVNNSLLAENADAAGAMMLLSEHLASHILGNNNNMEDNHVRSNTNNNYNSNSEENAIDDDDDFNTSQADSSVASDDPNDANSMIVAVSPSHAEYIESYKTQRKLGKEHFCVFCSTKFTGKLDAYFHYGEHLDYRPVLCLLCDNKFHDIETFTLHHQTDHAEDADLMYEIREDQNIEKWVDDFLESQSSTIIQRLLLDCSCATHCPVCSKVRVRKWSSIPCYTHGDLAFSDHIHQHLAYYAYECIFCKKAGGATRVPSLGPVALCHIQSHHLVKDVTFQQLGKFFPKTSIIGKLERFINEAVQRRKVAERKWKASADPKARISSVVGETQYSSNGLSFPNSLLSNITSNAKINKPGVNHVRVEGGRVINLPSSYAIRALQQQNLQRKNNVDLSRELTDRSIVGLSAGLRFFIKCLHCNLEFSSRKQLKIHHRREHPDLSIACFTTPRPINVNPTTA